MQNYSQTSSTYTLQGSKPNTCYFWFSAFDKIILIISSPPPLLFPLYPSSSFYSHYTPPLLLFPLYISPPLIPTIPLPSSYSNYIYSSPPLIPTISSPFLSFPLYPSPYLILTITHLPSSYSHYIPTTHPLHFIPMPLILF